MQIIKVQISKRLRDTRVYFGYSQVDVAKALNIKADLYRAWEYDRRLIPLNHLNNLSNFYNVSIDYLLGLTDDINKKISIKDIDLDIISLRLKEIRKDNNLSVKDFSKSLNSSKATFTNYESKKRLIQTAFCYDIARIYNISVDYLLGKSNIKYI